MVTQIHYEWMSWYMPFSKKISRIWTLKYPVFFRKQINKAVYEDLNNVFFLYLKCNKYLVSLIYFLFSFRKSFFSKAFSLKFDWPISSVAAHCATRQWQIVDMWPSDTPIRSCPISGINLHIDLASIRQKYPSNT